MKIIHLISGLGRGGAEHSLLKLIEETKDLDHQVIVMSNTLDLADNFLKNGIRIHVIDFRSRLWLLPYNIFKLAILLHRLNADAVQTWMYYANVVGGILSRLFTDAPIFWGIHHTSPCSIDLSKFTLFINKISRLVSSWVPSRIIYCSNSARVEHERFGYPSKMGVTIPNGYDHHKFAINEKSRDSVRRNLSILENDFVIGFVGRYHTVKGVDIFIESVANFAKKVSGVKVIMIGSGFTADNVELDSDISRNALSDCVILLGQQNNVADIMNAFDILILTSRSEAFPNVLNEAMLCGVPCISSDVGDSSIIVSDTGWIVEPCNVNAFASAIMEAMNSFTDRPNWLLRRIKCRDHISENFNITKMGVDYSNQWTQGKEVLI